MQDETVPMVTVTPNPKPMSITAKKFVREWGELGERWGLERRTADVHALLMLSPKPMTVGEIGDKLDLDTAEARKAIDELREWRVVESAAGSVNEERWQVLQNMLEMFRNILEERRRREMDPAMGVLRDCVLKAESDPKVEKHVVARLEELQDLFRLTQSFYKFVGTMPTAETRKLLKLGQKIRSSIGG
jgi:DNA-binding transcriptional regulator GbsR (MarR family)